MACGAFIPVIQMILNTREILRRMGEHIVLALDGLHCLQNISSDIYVQEGVIHMQDHYLYSLVFFQSWILVMIVTPSQLRYSCNSGNVPGPHIILWVELLTPSTSGLPFLLCSPFILTLLIRKHRLVILLFCSIVLCSQTSLRSETLDSLCPISGYHAFYAP